MSGNCYVIQILDIHLYFPTFISISCWNPARNKTTRYTLNVNDLLKQWALAILVLMLAACEGNPCENGTSDLIQDFKSCEKYSIIKSQLESKITKWDIVEDNSTKKNDPRPAYHILRIKIDEYRHLGMPGNLTIAFFNDELFETTFYPNNIDEYLKKLKNVEIDLGKNKQVTVSKRTSVKMGKDYQGKDYIEWKDKRINKVIQHWIDTYS